MGRFKCYDIAESVIDEATKQFHGMTESPKGKELLKALCEKIDVFIDAVDADGFSIVVDEATTECIFDIGKNQAYALMHSAGFPSITIGNRIYVEQEHLRKWIDTYSGRKYVL